jgi:SAM-dependent methyltransferase
MSNGSLDMPRPAGSMKYRLKRLGRSALAPLLYRYPPFALAPERLYVLLHYLIETRDVPGPVVEVGCNLGGTAIIAKRLLKGLGASKPYVCIDTFDGFIGTQFSTDVALGTPSRSETLFSGNSRALVAKILRQHGCGDVKLVEGDIITLPEERLPHGCSLVLVDVDLTEPTYAALKRFLPRMAPGGVILVDDCGEGSPWKARIGYSRACREERRAESYLHEMGIIAC